MGIHKINIKIEKQTNLINKIMCLYTSETHPIIAQEDIIAYKRCQISDRKLMSFYRNGHHYAKKERVKLGRPEDYFSNYYSKPLFEINRGLHANLTRSQDHNTKWIIPKGSKIYYSCYGNEIVSNRMDFVEFIGVGSSWRNERPNFGIIWRNNFIERLIRETINAIF